MNISLSDGRNSLYQYDTGRTLVIRYNPTDSYVEYIHFKDGDDTISVPVVNVGNTGTCMIPDPLLTESGRLTFYTVDTDNGSATTTTNNYRIIPRPMPEGYDMTIVQKQTFDTVLSMAEGKVREAAKWAGEGVTSEDEQFENNSKHYSELSAEQVGKARDWATKSGVVEDGLKSSKGYSEESREWAQRSADEVTKAAAEVSKAEDLVSEASEFSEVSHDWADESKRLAEESKDWANKVGLVDGREYSARHYSELSKESADESKRYLNAAGGQAGLAGEYAVNAGASADRARNWAVSENIVDNTDFSAKHYSEESSRHSEVSHGWAVEAEKQADKAKRYYKPSVDADGNLSWTPTRGDMDPIEPVNVYGDTLVSLTERVNQLTNDMNMKFAYAEYEGDFMIHFYDSDGNELASVGPIVGGTGTGGGGATAGSVMKIINPYGTNSIKVPSQGDVKIRFEWSSTDTDNGNETGEGFLTVKVNGKTTISGRSIAQGPVEIGIAGTVAGNNRVQISITDLYGLTKSLTFNVNVINLSLVAEFDETVVRNDEFIIPCVPSGDCDKSIKLSVDGEVVAEQQTAANGRRVQMKCPRLSHGEHDIKVWFEGDVDGEIVPSNTLEYKIIYVSSTEPIIVVRNSSLETEQYYTLQIRYQVWTSSMLDKVVLTDVTSTEVPKSSGEETWNVSKDVVGEYPLSISAGGVTRELTLSVTPSTLNIQPATSGLELYLTSKGHVKGDELTWGECEFSDTFNGVSDGWQLDSENYPVMRLTGDDRIYIDLKPFSKDIRQNGKTIEFEFATHDVFDYETVILSCLSGGIGIEATAQAVTLYSSANRLYTQYKEDEHIRVSFVVSSIGNLENTRIVYCYINGIMSGAYQYASGTVESFTQSSPVGITLGGNGCTTDIYSIRIYDHDISRYEVFDNMLIDMQDGKKLLKTYLDNQIYNNDVVSSEKLLSLGLPVLVIEGDLPMEKGTPTTMSGSYTDPLDSSKSFTFSGASVDIQGTSSKDYPVSNFKIKFKNGFNMETGNASKYSINGGIPVSTFTFKADYASSEGANNVELVRLYDEVINYTKNGATPIYQTPAQERNPNCRQGIDGFPIAIFHKTEMGSTFVGKYNFNYDKGNDDVFGFDNAAVAGIEGDQAWEITDNQSSAQVFKSADFNTYNDIHTEFEFRYPDEKEVDWNDPSVVADLKEMIAWVASTDTTVAGLSESQKQARREKFRNEFEDHFDLNSALFYYIFTDVFLMVDSRAKNAMPTRYVEDEQGNGKWCWLPYDMDTAMGIDNGGQLLFGYSLEDTMQIYGADVYNGQQSVLWNNLRDCFKDELVEMYSKMRAIALFSFDSIEKRFEEHQSKWPIQLWNEDAYYKYIYTYLFGDRWGNRQNRLYMLQGSKEAQRKWWLYNRFKYMDSKYYMTNDQITFRAYANNGVQNTFEITPYADIYAAVEFGNEGETAKDRIRTLRGETTTIQFPAIANPKDIVVNIYGASQLKDVGDLSGFKPDQVNIAAAQKLQNLKVGDGGSYVNESLKNLELGSNYLLKKVDARNCPNLNTTIDASGCTSLEELYLEGSSVTAVTLPATGSMKVLHLPSTIKALELKNQVNVTDYQVSGYSDLESIWIENCSDAIVADVPTIIATAKDGAHIWLTDAEFEFDTQAEFLAFIEGLDRFKGFNPDGSFIDGAATISGKVIIHDSINITDYNHVSESYRDLQFEFDSIVARVTFMSEDGSTVIESKDVPYQSAISFTGTEPSKASTVQYNFSFVGWSDVTGSAGSTVELGTADSDKVFYAWFYAQTRSYTITFVNDDGSVIRSYSLPYGQTPTYTWNDPTPVNTEDYGPFIGWAPEFTEVTGDAIYTAKYKLLTEMTRPYIEGTIRKAASSTATSIRKNAFNGKAITSASFPNVTNIGESAFNKCTSLVTVDFPNATTVEKNAFYQLPYLGPTISFPNVTSVGVSAFYNCVGMQSANFPSLKDIGESAFYSCSNLAEINVENVETIGYQGLRNLHATTLYLPNVKSIGQSGLYSTYLKEIIVGTNNDTVCTLGSQGIRSATGLKIYVPDNLVEEYKAATNWSSLASYIFGISSRT